MPLIPAVHRHGHRQRHMAPLSHCHACSSVLQILLLSTRLYLSFFVASQHTIHNLPACHHHAHKAKNSLYHTHHRPLCPCPICSTDLSVFSKMCKSISVKNKYVWRSFICTTQRCPPQVNNELPSSISFLPISGHWPQHRIWQKELWLLAVMPSHHSRSYR